MIHTKNRDWLVERLDNPQVDWLTSPIEPMLAQSRDKPFDSPDHLYEVKWDGIRAFDVAGRRQNIDPQPQSARHYQLVPRIVDSRGGISRNLRACSMPR